MLYEVITEEKKCEIELLGYNRLELFNSTLPNLKSKKIVITSYSIHYTKLYELILLLVVLFLQRQKMKNLYAYKKKQC